MATWLDKYEVVGIVPGVVVTRQFGEVDFSRSNLDVAMCDKLYQSGCRYLKLKEIPKPSADVNGGPKPPKFKSVISDEEAPE